MELLNVKAEVIKACMVLGINRTSMTVEIVREAWKRRIQTLAPDDTSARDIEQIRQINQACDTLIKWLEPENKHSS